MISRALMVWASLFDLKNRKSTQTVSLLFEILDEISTTYYLAVNDGPIIKI